MAVLILTFLLNFNSGYVIRTVEFHGLTIGQCMDKRDKYDKSAIEARCVVVNQI